MNFVDVDDTSIFLTPFTNKSSFIQNKETFDPKKYFRYFLLEMNDGESNKKYISDHSKYNSNIIYEYYTYTGNTYRTK